MQLSINTYIAMQLLTLLFKVSHKEFKSELYCSGLLSVK